MITGMLKSVVFFNLLLTLSIFASAAMPDYYSEPGFSNLRKYEKQQDIEYIDPQTGSLQLQNIDLVVPGNGGLDIVVRRFYRSLTGPSGVPGQNYLGGRTVLGLGWDMHFGRIWHQNSFSGPGRACGTGNVSSKGNPVLELADGTRKVLVDADLGNDYGYITKDRWIGKCISGGGLEVVSPQGIHYFFEHFQHYAQQEAWHVTRIEDRFGNALDIEYHTGTVHALISTISSSDGRNVSFHYDDKSKFEVLLKEIRLNNSWKMRYQYKAVSGVNDLFYLVTAERRVSGDWEYLYNESSGVDGRYSLRRMTNPYGTQVNYEYDRIFFGGRSNSASNAISKKTVSRGGIQTSGTWTYSYTPGTASNPVDKTTIKSPNYCTQYEHRGSQSKLMGQVWRIGTILEKRIYNSSSCSGLVQVEAFDWTTSLVARQNEYHRTNGANVADENTYQGVLSNKVVTLDGSDYTTEFSNFDSFGNPKKVVESAPNSGSRTTNYTYKNFTDVDTWIIGKLLTKNISSLGTISYEYFTNGVREGSLKKETHFGVDIATYDYYTSGRSLGSFKTVADAEGNIITYSDYYRGVFRTEKHPEGVTISRAVNSTGTVASETNGRGYKTSYTYDSQNRITSIATPRSDDANIAISWNNGGRDRVLTCVLRFTKSYCNRSRKWPIAV